MRGADDGQQGMFSYVSLEERVPANHPLRPIRAMTNRALRALTEEFSAMYSTIGRPSIAPERLLRALLVQALYSIRSERLLMEQLDYNLLFRWFVGLRIDEGIWDATVFTKNRAGCWKRRWRACFWPRWWSRPGRPGCSPTSTSRWMPR